MEGALSDSGDYLFDRLSASAFIDAMVDEVVILDRDGVIVAANAAWDQFCIENGGDESRCYRGANYIATCRDADGASGAEASIIPDGLAKTLLTGEPFKCEYPCDSPIVKRWFELTASRLIVGDETYLIVVHQNISVRHIEREAVERAHVTANAMAALIATTSDAVLSYDLNGNIITWNRAAEKLYGYTENEVIGRSLESLYPPDWPKRISYYRDAILAGRLENFEATRVGKDGVHREVWISCAPIRGASGEVVAISNIHRDVTEVRKAERARDLIAHEVIHRAKNMLTIVNAIQRQTARIETTLEGFMQSFEARLTSLSQSTDLLVKSEWSSIQLGELIERHLEPFVAPADKRLTLNGPAVRLQPQCVQTVGMAIHELATNSAKYGALTQDCGMIDIVWSVVKPGDDPTLQLSWREACVTIQGAVKRKGFGNTVLTQLAPSLLDAEANYDIGQGEVTWTISVLADHFSQ